MHKGALGLHSAFKDAYMNFSAVFASLSCLLDDRLLLSNDSPLQPSN